MSSMYTMWFENLIARSIWLLPAIAILLNGVSVHKFAMKRVKEKKKNKIKRPISRYEMDH